MADDESVKVHTLHMDTLEYTRSGLDVREPIALQVGVNNRIVLVHPEPTSAVTLSGFDFDSAFPGAPLAALLADRQLVQTLSSLPEQAVVQVLGHANLENKLDHNKALSEQRAKVIATLVSGDTDAFAAAAHEDGWGTAEHQALLRIIGFDPGPIDGSVGPMTRAAIRDFQHCINTGALEADPAQLPESGELDGDTIDGLYRAFVIASSPSIDPSALHPTHPHVGCTEYNPISADPPIGNLNRRVTLVIHDQLPPHHDAAPCTAGDHGVCPVTTPENNCMWYREHYVEARHHPPQFFDFQWLKLSAGEAILSVLTNLPSDTRVEIQLWRNVQDFDGSVLRHTGSTPLPARGERIGAPVVATIRNGICFARWTAPDDEWSPFIVEEWFADADAEEGTGLRPPLFSVQHDGGWAFSRPPGVRLDRLLFSGRTSPGAIVMSNVGELIAIPDDVTRVPSFEHVHLDEHVMAVGAAVPEGFFAMEDRANDE